MYTSLNIQRTKFLAESTNGFTVTHSLEQAIARSACWAFDSVSRSQILRELVDCIDHPLLIDFRSRINGHTLGLLAEYRDLCVCVCHRHLVIHEQERIV